MSTDYYVERFSEKDVLAQKHGTFDAMPKTEFRIPVGAFVIKSWDMYHDEDRDLTEGESWHPEFGIFLTEADAEKRLKDLEVSSKMDAVMYLLSKKEDPTRKVNF